MRKPSLSAVLTGLALLFHIIGLVGIGFAHNDAILRATPVHLALMTALLLVSARGQRQFYPWAAAVFVAGFVAEWIGVHTGLLFGNYKYGAVLGPQVDAIPLLIGTNWIIVVTGAASVAGLGKGPAWAKAVFTAVLATGFDWLLEPVAVKLGYWSWAGGDIPTYNYICWAGLSFLIALAWYALKLRPNHFAIILFFIQAVFFAALRLLL